MRFSNLSFLLVSAATISLVSCTKEQFVQDDPVQTESHQVPTKAKHSFEAGPVEIGTYRETGKPIMATLRSSLSEAGEHGLNFPHVHVEAVSVRGDRKASFDMVLKLDEGITDLSDINLENFNVEDYGYEVVFLSDVQMEDFLDGECDWCECVTGITNGLMNADPTGGFTWAIYGATCPQCVVVIGVGIAAYCAGSALNALTNG